MGHPDGGGAGPGAPVGDGRGSVTGFLLVLAGLLWVPAGAPAQEEPPAAPAGEAAAEDPIRSGPMVGYSTMREVLLWVQTDGPARVHFVYYDTLEPARRFSTDTVRTREDSAFVAKLVADSVQPGTGYGYEVHVDGRRVERPYPLRFRAQELWQWRRDPPAFRMALGSCAYVNDPRYDRPGEPYGGGYGIFRAIHEKRPDAMLWLGDNTYLREADWNSRTGILHRYTHTRSLPELQPLLASTHHYAIWDDHDYGPNNSDRSFWEKETTREAFRLFWGNPCFGAAGLEGIACTFRWSDVRFFLMDDRWYRTPNRRVTGERDMLGEEQIRWLVDALASSHATFNVVAVGGQVLNPVARYEGYADFPAERQRLLYLLRQEEIPGVVFLSGDRHFTEMTVLERPGTYPLHEFTISPLTSEPYEEGDREPNYRRVEGTAVTERNFAVMEVTGPRRDRTMTITVFDREGEEVWSRSLSARDLR